MDAKKPTKETVHAWMQARAAHPQPIPSIADIRRALGFDLKPKGPEVPR